MVAPRRRMSARTWSSLGAAAVLAVASNSDAMARADSSTWVELGCSAERSGSPGYGVLTAKNTTGRPLPRGLSIVFDYQALGDPWLVQLDADLPPKGAVALPKEAASLYALQPKSSCSAG